MPSLTKNDWKGLWAILWRSLVFGPIVWTTGSLLLTLLIAAFVAPPIYGVFAFLAGEWVLDLAALIPWFILLRFRRSICVGLLRASNVEAFSPPDESSGTVRVRSGLKTVAEDAAGFPGSLLASSWSRQIVPRDADRCPVPGSTAPERRSDFNKRQRPFSRNPCPHPHWGGMACHRPSTSPGSGVWME